MKRQTGKQAEGDTEIIIVRCAVRETEAERQTAKKMTDRKRQTGEER